MGRTDSPRPPRLYLFEPPYRLPRPITQVHRLEACAPDRAASLLWCMGSEPGEATLHEVRNRPGGIPLLVILPRTREIDDPGELLRMVEICRPHAVLPFHQEPDPIDLRTLLREPPHDLPQAVVDYLGWRGLVLDPEIRNLIRRVIELSSDLRTVSGLARGVYMSRRALGRAFLREGLPVPSHWLHMGRLLRVVLDIQWRGDTLMRAASAHGYPDGFSLSNQMARLAGIRPSMVKERIGWEWVFESWIRREVERGGFSAEQATLLGCGRMASHDTEGAQSA